MPAPSPTFHQEHLPTVLAHCSGVAMADGGKRIALIVELPIESRPTELALSLSRENASVLQRYLKNVLIATADN